MIFLECTKQIPNCLKNKMSTLFTEWWAYTVRYPSLNSSPLTTKLAFQSVSFSHRKKPQSFSPLISSPCDDLATGASLPHFFYFSCVKTIYSSGDPKSHEFSPVWRSQFFPRRLFLPHNEQRIIFPEMGFFFLNFAARARRFPTNRSGIPEENILMRRRLAMRK